MNYWEKRANERMHSAHKKAGKTVKGASKYYKQAEAEILNEYDKLLVRFIGDNGITPIQAKAILNQTISEMEYNSLKYLRKTVLDEKKQAKMLLYLNSPAYKARITRLEALKEEIRLKYKQVAIKEIQASTGHYRSTIEDSYYHTIYDTSKGLGVGIDFANLDEKIVNDILINPWSGKHFSKRIWDNTDVLAKQVTDIITTGFILGKPSNILARELAERTQSALFACNRIVRTETTYMAVHGEIASYKELGINKQIFVATLDKRTSEACRENDGKIIEVDKAVIGVNVPPLHPFCRSVVVAAPEDLEDLKNGTRVAKTPVTGEVYKVPQNMTYKEWFKEYVEPKPEALIAEKKWKYMYSDAKQYERYKEVLGDDKVPETFEKFQDLKYNNSEDWELFKSYYRAVKIGELTLLADFELYKNISEEIDDKLIGVKTINNIEIKSKSKHFIARVIGSVEQRRNGVDVDSCLKILTSNQSAMKRNIIFLKGVGSISINNNTGNLIQVNPLSRK